MTPNTLQHISDKSVYKTFDPEGTSFPPNITNVQDALAALQPFAVTGIPIASESEAGIIRLASQDEVDLGDSTDSAVSPATLKVRLQQPQATETVAGITRYATNQEAIAGIATNAAIVASSLKASIDNTFNTRLATELSTGVLKISTLPAAEAGTDDTTAMTPRKVAAAIAKATGALPKYSAATNTIQGIVYIASTAQLEQGTLNDGWAVSPRGLASLTSSASRKGIIQLANTTEVAGGVESTKAITPATLLSRTAAVGRLGLTKLTTTVGSGDANTALAYNANVISTGGGTINGTLNVVGNLRRNGQDVVTRNEIQDDVPVGTIVMWGGRYNNIPSKWRPCVGGTFNGAKYIATVGNKWGSNGAIPNFMGLSPRGSHNANENNSLDTGRVNPAISAARTAVRGKTGLGVGVGSYGHGTVQAQQIRKHQHAGGFGEHDDAGTFGNSVRANMAGTRKGLDWDNRTYFTNDGTEVDSGSPTNARYNINPQGLIGDDNRPWQMSILFIIKVE